MSFIGDLERAFATTLYPLRVPIAIGLAVGLVVLVLLARRRGWFAAARRHPIRTLLLATVLLVVGLPTAWYLGSPLFIRTTLVEPGPSSGPVPIPSGSTATVSPAGPTAASTQVPVAGTERTGTFEGADDFHFGSGTARLIETSPGVFSVRFEGFSVRNGPDLFVYLSPDPEGYAAGAIEVAPLKATDGDFNTPVPPGTDVSNVRSVLIWCKEFAVLFAVAELS